MSNTFYNVTSTTSFSTDGDIFDVLNGASLDLTGSSNTVVVQSRPDNGQTDTAQIFILGNDNTVVARDTSGIHAILGGSGNVVMMGSNSLVSDDGGIGDTITVGAGGGLLLVKMPLSTRLGAVRTSLSSRIMAWS